MHFCFVFSMVFMICKFKTCHSILVWLFNLHIFNSPIIGLNSQLFSLFVCCTCLQDNEKLTATESLHAGDIYLQNCPYYKVISLSQNLIVTCLNQAALTCIFITSLSEAGCLRCYTDDLHLQYCSDYE